MGLHFATSGLRLLCATPDLGWHCATSDFGLHRAASDLGLHCVTYDLGLHCVTCDLGLHYGLHCVTSDLGLHKCLKKIQLLRLSRLSGHYCSITAYLSPKVLALLISCQINFIHCRFYCF